MTGSAFLPIGSYMLDMPIEGSYRYCRITSRLSRVAHPPRWRVSRNVNLPFLPKPFDGKTLRARVRAILAAPVQPPILKASALEPWKSSPVPEDGISLKSCGKRILSLDGSNIG